MPFTRTRCRKHPASYSPPQTLPIPGSGVLVKGTHQIVHAITVCRVRRKAVKENKERSMEQETFNLSIRKFLKMIGVNSQREIEHAVQTALQQTKLSGSEALSAKMTLEIPAIGLKVPFDGELKLK